MRRKAPAMELLFCSIRICVASEPVVDPIRAWPCITTPNAAAQKRKAHPAHERKRVIGDILLGGSVVEEASRAVSPGRTATIRASVTGARVNHDDGKGFFLGFETIST